MVRRIRTLSIITFGITALRVALNTLLLVSVVIVLGGVFLVVILSVTMLSVGSP